MPRISTNIIGFSSKLIVVAITGRPMTNVSIFPKSTESDGESSFCFRNSKVNAAKLIPEKIRKILLDPQKEEVPEVGELLLFFAARSFHVNNVIQPALAEGKYVVCDRFTDATIAYQGSGRGFNVDRINLIANWVHKNIEPDMTILLDAPAEIGMERAKKRGSKDRMESEQMSFYRRVRKGYLNLAKNEPKRFAIIDATKTLIEVQKDITKHLENLVNE